MKVMQPKRIAVSGIVCLLVVLSATIFRQANAAGLPSRSLLLSNAVAGTAHVTYTLNFSYESSALVGSVKLEFCQEGPIHGEDCLNPNRPSFATATLGSQLGETGFSIDPSSTDNAIVLTRVPSVIAALSPSTYVFDGVLNQPQRGTGYLRISTYASTDATGPSIDKGGIAYVMAEELQLTTEVPPYLEFCVAAIVPGLDCSGIVGSVADFGDLSTTATAIAASQMAAATNADSGYGISYYGATMTSGNHTISALANPTASVLGVSQFGTNLRANTNPQVGSDTVGPGIGVAAPRYNTPNLYTFASGDTVAAASDVTNFTKYTNSYIVNINGSQPAGYYATTISYVCVGNF